MRMAEWTQGIEDALAYIEMHLTEDLEIREIAKRRKSALLCTNENQSDFGGW
jgi:hypothetical protein